MKSLHILTASAVALASFALAGTAMSQTTVRISGATTYRGPIHKAIQDSLDAGYTYAYDNSTATSATALYGAGAAIFKGTLNIAGHPSVIIKTYFTGSAAGVVDLAQQNNITKWIPTSATTTASPGTQVNGTGYTPETAPCQASLTDSFASSVAASVTTANAAGTTAAKAIKKLTLIDAGATAGASGTIGLVPFTWVMGKVSTAAGVPTYNYTVLKTDGTPDTKTATQVPFGNITQQQAASLISAPAPLSFFTGSAADKDKFVLLIGRNEDSGTRIGSFAEGKTGFGQSTTQFQLTFNANATTGGGLNTGGAGSDIIGGSLWPANSPLNTAPLINWNTAGHSGYVGGGDVGNVLKSTNPVLAAGFTAGLTGVPSNLTHAYFVGYLGIADATGVTTGTQLSYNGVPYSIAAVQNGQYSFWSFEHLYYIGSGVNKLTAPSTTIVDTIADKIFSTDANVNSSGVNGLANAAGIFFDSSVLVTRGLEGDVISGTYY